MLLRNVICFWMFFFASVISKAEESVKNTVSMGQFANNELKPPVEFLGDFITTGSLIVGAICFFWSFVKFLEYKKNPYTTTLGSVIAIVLPAIAFVSLSFLSFIIGVEVNPLKK